MTRVSTNAPGAPRSLPPPGFDDLRAQLARAIAPGRGNSHWLSFKEADRLVKLADRMPAEEQGRFRSLLADGLKTGSVDGQALTVGARALTRLAEFAGVDPRVYLDAAPALAEATGAKHRLESRFERSGAAAALPGATRASPSAAMAATVGQGLEKIAAAVTQPLSAGAIKTVEDAQAFAEQKLAQHLADKGLAPDEAGVSIVFDRALWPADAFKNQQALDEATTAAAGFLAQMAQDRGGPANLDVHLVPKGKLERTEGTERDNLYVPVNGGRDALELRQDWDQGAFIRADSWWSPADHIQAKKLRTLWKLVGNPVGVFRTRMRRVLGGAQIDLQKTAGKLLDRVGSMPLDRLRAGVEEAVRSFVAPHVKTRGGANMRQALLDKVAVADERVLVSFLGRFQEVASDTGFLEEVNQFALGATSNRLRDSQTKIGLVNVDTYDTVSVTPDSALARHGEPAVNDVELNGVRIGLVNVQSVDMVTVVPDLARMIFGGTALERAADASGLLD